ncbi:MAG: lytic murein transglycosylase [Hyphomicrobiales bacterium]|nr:MAG: lytic murein transglycosylase [Hyphomicrobiales bacterium]
MLRREIVRIAGAVAVTAILAGPAAAACKNTGSFDAWMAGFKKHAVAEGVSQRTVDSALRGITLDPRVIKRDRAQSLFSLTYVEFVDRLVSKGRINGGRKKLKQHAKLFARIERDYGVPGPVLAAFWGLETDFGGFMGDFQTLRSLATLAYDCRRPEMFTEELVAGLKLIDNGDLKASEMVGAWAGELGHTQFLMTDYFETAVDYDGDGHRNLVKSVPDALASGARLLQKYGWRAGEPWIVEVRVPNNLAWQEADLAITHPQAQWAQWGVRRADGSALSNSQLPASLLLPMGHKGPAFLAYNNFRNAYINWNNSLTYSLTAAYFATRLAGAPPLNRNGVKSIDALSFNQIKEMQRLLTKKGYDVGGVDGTLGEKSRAAVKAVQAQMGLPQDAFPTGDFLARLRRM